MKKLRADINHWLEGLDKNWDAMPIKKQHQVILYFFAAYVLLTAVAIFNVCRDKTYAKNNMNVEHIQNPAQPEQESRASVKDSLKPILKK